MKWLEIEPGGEVVVTPTVGWVTSTRTTSSLDRCHLDFIL